MPDLPVRRACLIAERRAQTADVVCATCAGAGDPRLAHLRFRKVRLLSPQVACSDGCKQPLPELACVVPGLCSINEPSPCFDFEYCYSQGLCVIYILPPRQA